MKIVENALPLGTVLDSGQHQYRIVKVLGQGGFGITYQAVAKIKVGNVQVDVPFAVKEHFISSFCGRQGESVTIPNPSNAQEVNDSLNSFLTEAERLNRLSLEHDGLVKVNESFQANGTAYYVMEYIGGENLRQYVKRQPAGKLSETEALPIIRKVADAVGYLHRSQVTHLDIKPDNILLRDDGTPVLIDFGLAKHYDKKGKATSTLKVAGCSDGYSPLEQYAGIDHFSPQADVYALAATLLFLLTGRDPRKASEISREQIEQSLPSDVSEETSKTIVYGMQKLAESRIKCVDNLMEGLRKGGELVGQERKENEMTDDCATKTRKRNVVNTSKPLNFTLKYNAVFFGVTLLVGLVFFMLFRGGNDTSYDNLEQVDCETDTALECVEEVAEEAVEVVDSIAEDYYSYDYIENEPVEVAEQMPSFPGGENALMEFLSKNTKYPSVAEENGIQGRVVCTFVVETNGSITDVKVVRAVDPALDREAVRVIKSMPKWIPGKQNGKAVRVTYTVPVTFKFE